MKKFNRNIHTNMGALPRPLLNLLGDADIAAATTEFNSAMTRGATEFHHQLGNDVPPADIKLPPLKLFGHDVRFDYVASGSVGSVYKMQIGDQTFAFKINRNASHGELAVMPMQKRARSLVNRAHIGAVFEHNGRKYSWVLSDYIADDKAQSFESAMQKLYFTSLTKGIIIHDAHRNNFKDGKLIDIASLDRQRGGIVDIQQLSRIEIDMVRKLANCIKTDDMDDFERLISRANRQHPAVIKYMFFAMKYARPPMYSAGKSDAFSDKIKKYEDVVNSTYRQAQALAKQHNTHTV